MSNLLKEPNTQPAVWDENQYDWFVEDFLNLAEQIIGDLDRSKDDLFRQCIEFRRAEMKRVCGVLLNKLQGTEDKIAPIPFSVFRSSPSKES